MILMPNRSKLKQFPMGTVVEIKGEVMVPNYGTMTNVIGHVVGFRCPPGTPLIWVDVQFNGSIIKNVDIFDLMPL